MSIKAFIDEALVKGEAIKGEIADEILRSKVLQDLVSSDVFAKAVSTVLKTKEEVSRVLKHNVTSILQMMDIPSRYEIKSLERKVDMLEKTVDRAGRKSIAVKTLKSTKKKKPSRRSR